jgi:hypothetical protein
VTPDLDQIVKDVRLVARHVLKQPRGYCGVEVERARVLDSRVDLRALALTVYSVRFVTHVYRRRLTVAERTVAAAAARLDAALADITAHQQEITAALTRAGA